MVPDGLDWVSASLRTCRTIRDVGWWLRLSARHSMLEVAEREAARLTAELTSATGPTNGTLRQSLRKGQT